MLSDTERANQTEDERRSEVRWTPIQIAFDHVMNHGYAYGLPLIAVLALTIFYFDLSKAWYVTLCSLILLVLVSFKWIDAGIVIAVQSSRIAQLARWHELFQEQHPTPTKPGFTPAEND